MSDEFILPFDIDDDSETECVEYDVKDNHSDNQCFDIGLNTNYYNLER